jgi:hypothetical protein
MFPSVVKPWMSNTLGRDSGLFFLIFVVLAPPAEANWLEWDDALLADVVLGRPDVHGGAQPQLDLDGPNPGHFHQLRQQQLMLLDEVHHLARLLGS